MSGLLDRLGPVIDRVSGVLLSIDPEGVVIDLGGLGVRVEVTTHTAQSLGPLGRRVTLLTQLILSGGGNQEPQARLFGFKTPEARSLFGLLRGVSKIGPNTALRLLGAQPQPGDVAAAIARGDATSLKVKGVGPKTAARVINELKDRVGALLECLPVAATPDGAEDPAFLDAFLALKALEFEPGRARELLSDVRADQPDLASADDLVRAALQRS